MNRHFTARARRPCLDRGGDIGLGAHVTDAVYDQARQHFSETELVNLTLCVAAINAWNRIAIGFRAVHPMHWNGAA